MSMSIRTYQLINGPINRVIGFISIALSVRMVAALADVLHTSSSD